MDLFVVENIIKQYESNDKFKNDRIKLMRLLFEIGIKGEKITGKIFIRPSSRCINIKNGLVAMVHSKKYDYYKFPGGGINDGESKISALIRETKEETGLIIIPESIKEYGYVHRIEKSSHLDADYFIQDNYYYFCEVENNICFQNLDTYELEEEFTLEYVDHEKAIHINRNTLHGQKNQNMIEREAMVLELLSLEGYFNR